MFDHFVGLALKGLKNCFQETDYFVSLKAFNNTSYYFENDNTSVVTFDNMKRFCIMALLQKEGNLSLSSNLQKSNKEFFSQFVDTPTVPRFIGAIINLFYPKWFLLVNFQLKCQFTECIIPFILPLTDKIKNEKIIRAKKFS